MLTSTRHHTRVRRGIVLVLVLAMLGLLALIGVTFATFSGQARINARNFAQSSSQPQDDELLDFALSAVDHRHRRPRSVIRGHSLARDMFGNDANQQRLSPRQSLDRRAHSTITGVTAWCRLQITMHVGCQRPQLLRDTDLDHWIRSIVRINGTRPLRRS